MAKKKKKAKGSHSSGVKGRSGYVPKTKKTVGGKTVARGSDSYPRMAAPKSYKKK